VACEDALRAAKAARDGARKRLDDAYALEVEIKPSGGGGGSMGGPPDWLS
jgi:hypothetical protein